MTKQEFLSKIKEAHPQHLDEDYDGSCPCSEWEGNIDEFEFGFHTRCWRVSDNVQDLYVWGNHPNKTEIATAIKKELDKQKWYNPYTIIYKEFK